MSNAAPTRTVKAWREDCPLKIWRRENGWTQHDVATSLNFAVVTIKVWESGSRDRAPSDVGMAAIASLIGADPDELANQWVEWLASAPAA